MSDQQASTGEERSPSSEVNGIDRGESASSEAFQEVRGERSAAEWTSIAISLTIVLGMLALTLALYFTGGERAAVIEVTPHLENVRAASDQFYLPITIENTGGQTAETVIVEVTLATSSGEEETAEVTIDFLAGQATEDAVVSFSEDPRDGVISARVTSFLEP